MTQPLSPPVTHISMGDGMVHVETEATVIIQGYHYLISAAALVTGDVSITLVPKVEYLPDGSATIGLYAHSQPVALSMQQAPREVEVTEYIDDQPYWWDE